MKSKIVATAGFFAACGSVLLADSANHRWNITIPDGVETFCRFAEKIPVDLILNPTTGRFEVKNPGALTIEAQEMKTIAYTTDSKVHLEDGSYLGRARDWDFSQIKLSGSDGEIEGVISCNEPEVCFGPVYSLPANQPSDTYQLYVTGSLLPPEDYTPAIGDELSVTFYAQCYEEDLLG